MKELKNEKKVVQQQIFHYSLFTFHFFCCTFAADFRKLYIIIIEKKWIN